MADHGSTSWAVDEIQALIAQAPWWLCSAVVHLVIIVSLTLITFATIEPPRKRIIIETPLEQLEQRVEPSTKVDVLNEEKNDQAQMLAANPIETRVAAVIADAQSNAPVLAIEAPTASELSKLVDKGGMGFTPSTFGPGGNVGLISSRISGSKIGMTYDDVMDVMSENIVKEIQHNDLLIVLIFDETKSLLEDRRMIMQKVTRVVADLKKELKPREAARLKWAVIGYAPTALLWLQPTDNVEEVLESIRKMKVDDTGIENTCGAIRYALKTLSPLGKKMYLVVISDGIGKDTGDDKIYMQTLREMQEAKARFFVFGRESAFQQANVFEWLRDSKGERVGPWFWSERGIESCQQEFFATDWLFNHHKGERFIGAGFGCWTMTTLCELTRGIFFILSDVPSPYDEERLEKFKPEWITRPEYAERNAKSKLRTTMRKIIDEWQKADPPPSLVQLDQLRAERDEAIAKGEKAVKFAETAIEEMEALRVRRSLEKYQKLRWQADYDLVMAELYKFRFLLHDYVAVLGKSKTTGFPKPKPNQRFNYYRILYNTALTEPHTGPRGMKEWEQAKNALDQVANDKDYDGTPWSEVAKFEKNTTAPMWIFPAFDVQPTRPRG